VLPVTSYLHLTASALGFIGSFADQQSGG
jgi:hypothetical protein